MGPTRPRNSSRAGKAHPRILKARRKPAPSKPSKPTSARDAARLMTLHQIQAHLECICSVAVVIAHALRGQGAELDGDAASVLRWHVSDPLFEQTLRLKRIIAGGAP